MPAGMAAMHQSLFDPAIRPEGWAAHPMEAGHEARASQRSRSHREREEEVSTSCDESEDEKVKAKGKGKAKEKAKESGNAAATKSRPHSNMKQTGEDHEPRKSAYSAGLIRQLGFDPAAKDGKAVKHAGAQSKVC